MANYETQHLAVMRRQAKALERIASSLERKALGEIDAAGGITWQDAVRVIVATCEGAECGPACPMVAWCNTFNEGNAPADWAPVESEKEETE